MDLIGIRAVNLRDVWHRRDILAAYVLASCICLMAVYARQKDEVEMSSYKRCADRCGQGEETEQW